MARNTHSIICKSHRATPDSIVSGRHRLHVSAFPALSSCLTGSSAGSSSEPASARSLRNPCTHGARWQYRARGSNNARNNYRAALPLCKASFHEMSLRTGKRCKKRGGSHPLPCVLDFLGHEPYSRPVVFISSLLPVGHVATLNPPESENRKGAMKTHGRL